MARPVSDPAREGAARMEAEMEQARARLLVVESEQMAIRQFIRTHAEELGLEQNQAWDEIESLKRKIHAELLRLIENSDPGTAARLDKRPGLPEE